MSLFWYLFSASGCVEVSSSFPVLFSLCCGKITDYIKHCWINDKGIKKKAANSFLSASGAVFGKGVCRRVKSNGYLWLAIFNCRIYGGSVFEIFWWCVLKTTENIMDVIGHGEKTLEMSVNLAKSDITEERTVPFSSNPRLCTSESF